MTETVILKRPAPDSGAEGEAGILGALCHPNIVHLEGVLENDPKANDPEAMVLEYMSEGDFGDFLQFHQYPGSAAAEATIRRNIILDTLNGLIFLHAMNYVHRDIKPKNIFLSLSGPDRYSAKIGDLGLSRKMDETTKSYQSASTNISGTWGGIAPEIIKSNISKKNTVYDEKSDMYAMWRLILEAGSDSMPEFLYPDAKTEKDIVVGNRENKLPVISPEVSQETRKMFFICYRADPNKRPTAKMLLAAYQNSADSTVMTAESIQKLCRLIRVLYPYSVSPLCAGLFSQSVQKEVYVLRMWVALSLEQQQVSADEYRERFLRVIEQVKNLKGLNKQTLLMHASYGGDDEFVCMLLEAGAEINALSGFNHSALILAAQRGYPKIVQALLDRGADFERVGDSTPLIWAAYYGQLEVVKILIDWEAKLDTADKDGNTPLSTAIEAGNKVVAEFLKDTIAAKSSVANRF